jgi:hypothetical protein
MAEKETVCRICSSYSKGRLVFKETLLYCAVKRNWESGRDWDPDMGSEKEKKIKILKVFDADADPG